MDDFDANSKATFYEKKVYNAHKKNFYKNLPDGFKQYFSDIKDSTMLSRERLFAFYNSINYVIEKNIQGDVVEVGCWAGGSICMARANLNKKLSDPSSRVVYGFDTFEGHHRPNSEEVDVWGNNQAEQYDNIKEIGEKWADADIDKVKRLFVNVLGSMEGVELVKGKVEKTSRNHKIDKISVLRIDVDWYEPTLASLNQFYPLLSTNGVVIIDDYGHHSGSKKATDEFFANKPQNWFYTDYSCVSTLKTEQ